MELRRRMMNGKGESIPYQRIEYLESTGSQYIRIPAIIDSNGSIEIDGYNSNSNRELYSFDLNSYTQFNLETSSTFYRWFTNTPINAGSMLGRRHFFKCSNSLYVDNNYIGRTTPTYSSTTQNLYLLNGTHGITSGRVYSVSVYDNDDMIVNLFPVRIGQVGYMYDTVSGQLYGNAGTGNFILGSDIN